MARAPSPVNRCKSHLCSFAPRRLLPSEEQRRVILGDVVAARNPELFGGGIDPARRALDFRKVPDGRLIHYHMSSALAPFAAKFFVAESWTQSQHEKNRVQLLAVRYRCF